MTEDWMVRYNNERPHDSLNDMTPAEFLQANNQPGNSNLAWDQSGEVYILDDQVNLKMRQAYYLEIQNFGNRFSKILQCFVRGNK